MLPLIRAAHPKLGIAIATALALGTRMLHHSWAQVGLVFATVLLGQAITGWHNDLVDHPDDVRHGRLKPLATGSVRTTQVWIALTLASLVLLPLATALGLQAGLFYLGSVALAMVGNVALRTGGLSWLTWAGSYALLAGYLAHLGANRHATGHNPQWAAVLLFAALGVCVHVGVALWGLVPDQADGWTSLPLRLGRTIGSTRTFALVLIATLAIVVGLVSMADAHAFYR